MSKKRIKMINDKLSSLQPTEMDIIDEGHLHIGHEGTKKGGHFKVIIISSIFKGKTLIDRHRLIYEVLDDLMKTEIHALSIIAKTPDEF